MPTIVARTRTGTIEPCRRIERTTPRTRAARSRRPTLDGLEAALERRLGARRHLPLRPRGAPRERVYSIDTPPPTVSGSLHVGHVFSYTHTDASPATSGCAAGRSSTRWAGTTTACRPSGACRTTSACAATRPSRTTPRSSRPPSRPMEPVAISRPNFVELCLRLTEDDEQAFEALWRALGLSVDWAMTYTTIGADRAAHLPALVPRPAGAGRRLPARGADAVGRRLPDRGRAGRARGPRAARARCTACASTARRRRAGADRDDAPRADPGLRRAARAPR